MKNSEFLELEGVTIEFDDCRAHSRARGMYHESHFFFARIESGTSQLVHFVPLVKDAHTLSTFLDGDRARIDGEIFIVLDHRWGTLPVSVYGHEPPFDPIMMGVYVHRVHTLSDVDDPFPDTVWSDVPGMTHKIPDDDLQIREVAHGRKIAKLLTSNVENLNAIMEEGSTESDLADDIKDVQELISYNLRLMLKNVTREHIRGV